MDPVYNTINAHIEKTGNPGFTGQFPLDRIKYVGASSNGIGEVMQFGFPTNVNCVEVLLNTVFHREHVLGASLNTVGIALQNTFDNIYYSCAIYAGIKGTAQIRPTNWIGIYPGANQTNVPVNMITGEAPDPVPSIANADKGSPISIHFDQNITSISSFTVTEYGSSTSLPSVILGNKDFPQYISGSEAFMITKQAFKAKTTYNVAFTGFLKDGRAVTKGWSFTTV
jgi:hypothetical protein